MSFERRTPRLRAGNGRLYERQDQLAELEALAKGALPGSTGCVVIEGDWGTGKTALLNAACHIASETGVWTARARGRPAERRSRFAVAHEVLESVHHAWAAAGSIRAAAALHEALQAMKQPSVATEEIDQRIAAALRAPGPDLLFAIDDADRADNESLAVLSRVIRRLDPGRAWLVVTTRPRQPGTALRGVDWLLAEPDTRLLPVRALSATTVYEITAGFFDGPIEAPFVDAVWEATGGRPFLVFSLLAALAREQWDPSATKARDVREVVVPRIIQVALGRLATMSIAASDLLQAAAVLGDEVEFGQARELARIDAVAAERGAEAAVQGELLQQGRPLRFSSPLIRAAIYHDIPELRRARLHAEAVQILAKHGATNLELCTHLLQTEPANDPSRAEALWRAGRVAMDDADAQTALRFFARALAEPPAAERRADVLLDLALAEAGEGLASTLDHFRQAVHLGVPDVERLARTSVILLRRMPRSVHLDRHTAATLRQAIADLDPTEGGLHLEFELALRLASGDRQTDDLGDLERLVDRVAPGSSPLARHPHLYVAHERFRTAGWATADRVGDLMEADVEPSEIAGDDPMVAEIQVMAVLTLLYCGRAAVTVDALQAAATAASKRGKPATESELLGLLALCRLWQGELDASVDLARQGLAAHVAPRSGGGSRGFLARTCLAAALLEKGQVDEALALEPPWLVDGLAGDDNDQNPGIRTALPLIELFVKETRGRLRVGAGQLRQGLAEFVAAGRSAERAAIDNPAISAWRAEAGTTLAALGQGDEGRRLVAEHLDLARRFGEARTLGIALRAAAGLAEPDERVALLDEATELLERSPAQLETAKTLVELGAALRGVDRRNDARRALRRGAHLASLCGADGLVERASDELRAAGGRPRRIAMTGWEALTPAEARVAELATDGTTNQEIARALFVTEKTVEGHLARVYRKLGIRSRALLSAWRLDDPDGDEDRVDPEAVG